MIVCWSQCNNAHFCDKFFGGQQNLVCLLLSTLSLSCKWGIQIVFLATILHFCYFPECIGKFKQIAKFAKNSLRLCFYFLAMSQLEN